MQIRLHYQDLDHSPWMDQFIMKKVNKLTRYLGEASDVEVHVKHTNRQYVTSLAIHNPYKDYAFSSHAENLFESFSTAIDKAARTLNEHKRKIKDRINRRYTSLRKGAA